jgi:Tfp pilus assembly protein PilX
MSNKAQKGYVLAIVLVLTFVMSLSIVSTFSIVYRYMKLTERGIEDLRNDLYVPAITSEVETND